MDISCSAQKKTNKEVAEAMQSLNTKVELLATQGRLMESQLAQHAASSSRPAGKLPGHTEENPMEHVKAITLRSGTAYDGPPMPNEEEQGIPQPKKVADPTVETHATADNRETAPPNEVRPEVPKYIPPHRFLPFPQRLVKAKLDKQFGKFLEILKKLSITIPFTDALTQMPTYAKFMKDILSNKRRLEEVETVTLNEECSALFTRKLPPKLKDPGSFSIPCTIGTTKFDRALCDLGASVSLMPKSVFERLNVGNLKSTRISLQLADKSVRFSEGILENVIIQVGKFHVPVDFIVIEMEEDTLTPLILGRDFLSTAGARIDVRDGKITFDIGKENVEFDVFKLMQCPPEECHSICKVDAVNLVPYGKGVRFKRYPRYDATQDNAIGERAAKSFPDRQPD